jgi:hypothetical protein
VLVEGAELLNILSIQHCSDYERFYNNRSATLYAGSAPRSCRRNSNIVGGDVNELAPDILMVIRRLKIPTEKEINEIELH